MLVLVDDFAVQVDFHEVGGAHVLKQHAVLVDEEMVVRAGDAGADMGVDKIGHFVMRDEPVQGREIAAQFPFGLVHTGRGDAGGDVHYFVLLRIRLYRCGPSVK
jgi:hypothetical protein